MAPSGKLISVPIAPLIPLLYYRADLYKEAGLKTPATFTDLEANARRFHKPPSRYGIAQRGARGPASVSYDVYPYLYGFGGGIFKNPAADYSVTLNNEAGRTALDFYLLLAKEAGHPQTAPLEQAEFIQNMLTGKTAHIM
jgi:multiple sugar transport system substrate-binding protein